MEKKGGRNGSFSLSLYIYIFWEEGWFYTFLQKRTTTRTHKLFIHPLTLIRSLPLHLFLETYLCHHYRYAETEDTLFLSLKFLFRLKSLWICGKKDATIPPEHKIFSCVPYLSFFGILAKAEQSLHREVRLLRSTS